MEARSEVMMEGECDRHGRNSRSPGKRLPDASQRSQSRGTRSYQFGFESPRIRIRPEFAAYALQSFTARQPDGGGAAGSDRAHPQGLSLRFKSDQRADAHRRSLSESGGACARISHILQIACLRSLNLAARYVSGYLRTYPPPGRPRLVGADASHAWVSAYCPGTGWLDVDPTNNLVPSDGHVTLAWGRDYGDVSPLRGLILGGGAHTLKVAVDMEPVDSH